MAPAEAIKTREAAEEAGRGRRLRTSVNLAEGAAWSPNPNNPPLYLDLPVKDGKLQPDVIAKWAANAPLAMVGQYIPSLKMYKAIGMEVGTKDNLLASNKQLEEMLTRLRRHAHVRGRTTAITPTRCSSASKRTRCPSSRSNLSFDAGHDEGSDEDS